MKSLFGILYSLYAALLLTSFWKILIDKPFSWNWIAAIFLFICSVIGLYCVPIISKKERN